MARKKKAPNITLPQITILPSGAAHTRVLINGERFSITRDTEEEAIAEYIALKYGAKEAAKKVKRKDVTLDEAITNYINKRKAKKSPATIKGYEAYKKNRLQSMMGANVYATTDAQWQAAIARDFRKLSDKYAVNVWSFFASAIEEETGRRPKVDLDPPKKNKRPFLEPEEVLVFVNAMKGQTAEIAALLELSSLRVSEVLDVRGTDFDLKNNRIRICGAAVYGPDGKLVHKGENKTEASTRYIPLIPPLLEAISDIDLTDDYVVKMTSGGIYRQINRVCSANGLPKVGNHGLRHSFASLAYHLGIPEKIAMEIGGWEDSKVMHDIYTHLSKKDIAKRSQQFSDFFLSKTEDKKETVQIGNEIGNDSPAPLEPQRF